MEAKVDIKYDKNAFSVRINHQVSPKKSKLILAWIILWSVSGLIVLSQIFAKYSRDVKIMLVIWMAFWSYFLIRSISTYLWRTRGSEEIAGNDTIWKYWKFNGSKKYEKEIAVEEISKIIFLGSSQIEKKGTFADSSFLSIGNPGIVIETKSGPLALGIQLSEADSKKINKTLLLFSAKKG